MKGLRRTFFLVFVFCLWGTLYAQPDTGYISVSSVPPGAGVFLNGVFSGVTPFFSARRVCDSLPIAVSKQFFEPWKSTAKIGDGDTLRITANLRRLETRVTVTCSDPGGAIFVDGRYAALGAVQSFPVTPGNHELLVSDSLTGRSARTKFLIGEAQQQAYAADLGYRSFWRLAGALVLPGFAQCADGWYVKGGSIFVLSAAAIVFAVSSGNTYADRLDSYDAAVRSYSSASTEPDALFRRGVMFQSHDDLNHAYRTRSLSFVVLGTVYALNIVDTILHHLITDDIRFLPGKSDMQFVASAGTPPLSLRVELTLR